MTRVNRHRTIVLLTDFGLRDPYVGVMKGVIAKIAPGATTIDLLHDIPPQDVRAAAVALWAACRYFPPRAIFVAVVDPGVGTRRRILAAETEAGVFLAPDNGLLTLVLRDLPPRRVVSVVAPRYRLERVSSTFHGRDLFAPAAAWLARGVAPARLGPVVREWATLPFAAPRRTPGGCAGDVLWVDRFGNALTGIPGEWVCRGDVVRCGPRRVARVAGTYADAPRGGAVAVVSSAGTLEIAVNGGSAARRFGLRAGSRIAVDAIARERP